MLKEKRNRIILTSLITLVPLILGFIFYDRLPDRIPVHFDYTGSPDRYQDKLQAVLFMGLFFPFVHLFCILATFTDPKHKNHSDKLVNLVFWIVPLISLFVCLAVYGKTQGLDINVVSISTILVGLIFIIIGNYLPKCKQNYTIGIKCPWTLNDTENWDKTHRFSAYVFMLCGVITILSMFLKNHLGFYVMFASMMFAASVPFVYSYLLYRKKSQ